MEFEDQVEEATTFDPSEAPDGERLDGSETHRTRYERLADTNTLRWNGAWRNESDEDAVDRSASIRSVMSSLELTDHQRRKVILMDDRLPATVKQGFPVCLVAIVLSMIAGADDGRDYHPNNVHPNSENNHLQDFVDEAGFSYKRVYTCWETVQEEL